MAHMTLGNGAGSLSENWTYNSRLQPNSVAAGSALSLAFDYGTTNNNGNLLTQTLTAG